MKPHVQHHCATFFFMVAFQLHWSAAQNGVDGRYLDRWNYYGTEQRSDGFTDFGPEQWGEITCSESSRDGLDACLAYRDKWHSGQAWEIRDNYCRWCPIDSGGICGRHHMSPINLERNRGLGYWENDGIAGDDAHPMANECIDVHWMKYIDSFCTLDQLVEQDAFTIERHALRVTQPLTVDENDEVRLGCFKRGVGRKFGQIDFSKGFSNWWHLSHIDFHTPSEHAQEGKIYDAEVQLHHFYSVTAEVAGVNNELGTVAMFMQAYENAAPWGYLDKLICLWRRNEFKVREQCGLDPVSGTYPGCFPLSRKLRQTSSTNEKTKKAPFKTVHDLILYHTRHKNNPNSTMPKLIMDDINFGPSEYDKTDEEWDDFFAEESAKQQAEQKLWKETHRRHNDTEEAHETFRKLIEGDEQVWFNYFAMLGVKTEYYYRYSGSQTIPPCYGNFIPSTRKETNHWRFMKDPIRIHPRQLKELKRLIAERVAPPDDPVNPCKPDTAAKVTSDGDVVAARPLQYTHPVHFKTFCECKDWRSRWPEDRAWCQLSDDPLHRFYTQPYNFITNGF